MILRHSVFIFSLLQTIGCDFFEKKMNIKGDMIISMRVYDVGGQSINSKNLRQYLSGTSIIFLVYDLTNPESFHNLEDWLSAVKQYTDKARVYLIGNKVSLPTRRYQYSPVYYLL